MHVPMQPLVQLVCIHGPGGRLLGEYWKRPMYLFMYVDIQASTPTYMYRSLYAGSFFQSGIEEEVMVLY